MTPIFIRIWLMKMTSVFDFAIVPVSLRSAWLIRRACRPTWASPLSPSSSARGVDERADAAPLLGLADDVQRQRRLARRLRSVDLDDAPARQAAHAQRDVEAARTARDHLHLGRGHPLAETHDAPLAELLLDRRHRDVDRLLTRR